MGYRTPNPNRNPKPYPSLFGRKPDSPMHW